MMIFYKCQVLDSIADAVVDNAEELDAQKKAMSAREESATKSIFSSIYVMLLVFFWFVLTYAVIRLLPKPV